MLSNLIKAIAFASSLNSVAALADFSLGQTPVSLNCEVTDLENNATSTFTKIAPAAWAVEERVITSSTGGNYLLRTEGSNQESRIVIFLKNLQTDKSEIRADLAPEYERLSLEFETWRVVCYQSPYSAG